MVRYLLFLWLLTVAAASPGENIPKVYTVEIKGMKFVPEVLNVKKGDQVVWVNNDMVTHNVTNENGSWVSPSIPVKKTWKKTIQTNTRYYCSLHPVMKGSIVVK